MPGQLVDSLCQDEVKGPPCERPSVGGLVGVSEWVWVNRVEYVQVVLLCF